MSNNMKINSILLQYFPLKKLNNIDFSNDKILYMVIQKNINKSKEHAYNSLEKINNLLECGVTVNNDNKYNTFTIAIKDDT